MDRSMAAGAWKEQMPGASRSSRRRSAGVVEAIGEGADRFKVGEEVFGQLIVASARLPVRCGTCRRHRECAACSPTGGLDPIVAAALRPAGVTAAADRPNRSGAQRGKPSSWGRRWRVGSFAMQLAAQAGAHVIAVARADAADRIACRNYSAVENGPTSTTVSVARRGAADASRRASDVLST